MNLSDHPDYQRHYAEWQRTLPDAPHEVIHEKVSNHIAFKEGIKTLRQSVAQIPEDAAAPAKDYSVELRLIVALLVLIAFILVAALVTKAAPEPPIPPVVEFNAPHYLLLHPYTFALPQAGGVPIPLPVQGSGSSSPVYVICSSGCSAAGAFSDNSAFTVGTTPGSILFGYYTSGADPTLTSGNAARARIDAHSYVLVDCAVGCSGGTFNNNSDAVATSATNGQSAAWLYGFNGTTFDRLRVDGSKNLLVGVNAALPAGSNTIGAVTFPSAQPVTLTSTTITGNVAVTQSTSPWIVAGGGTAGTPGTAVLTVQGVGGGTAVPVSGTFWQSTQPVSAASLPLPSGAATSANQCGGATGSAVPANACLDGGEASSGNLAAHLQCDGYAFYDAATNGATQLVALVSGKTVYVCGYSLTTSTTTANTVKLVYGTGTNCATGQTAMTPGYVLQAATSTGPIGKVIPPTGMVSGLKTAASNELCVLTNAASAVQAEVWYAQF